MTSAKVVVGRFLRLWRITHWQWYASSVSLLHIASWERVDCCIVRDTTIRRLPYWAKGLFYPSWNRSYGYTAYRGSSVADCQALTCLKSTYSSTFQYGKIYFLSDNGTLDTTFDHLIICPILWHFYLHRVIFEDFPDLQSFSFFPNVTMPST